MRDKYAAAKNSICPRKNTAEGGCGGNSAVFLQKIEASPAALLVKAKHHRKILFLLREKEIRRAQNEKSKEYFFVVRRVVASGGGAASFVGGFPKMGSDFVQGVEPRFGVANDPSPSGRFAFRYKDADGNGTQVTLSFPSLSKIAKIETSRIFFLFCGSSSVPVMPFT